MAFSRNQLAIGFSFAGTAALLSGGYIEVENRQITTEANSLLECFNPGSELVDICFDLTLENITPTLTELGGVPSPEYTLDDVLLGAENIQNEKTSRATQAVIAGGVGFTVLVASSFSINYYNNRRRQEKTFEL